MSFRKNVLSNYCGHFYVTLIGIVIVPAYLKYLGAAAFGLISLYVILQSWLSLLNMGLIPALSREVTCSRDGKGSFLKVNQLLRSLEIIFLVINLFVVLGITLCSYWIAHRWLKVHNLSYFEVMSCISMMSIMIGFRFFSDLYRASISGMEEQVWLNGARMILATLQYGGAYILLRWITRTPGHFFEYQVAISAIEPILLGIKCYKIIPTTINRFSNFCISWAELRKILPFAGGLFYTAILWILVSQSDKLILSHILPLTTYGYFGLVTIISSGMLQFGMPIYLALLPKMTHLLSQNKKEEMLRLYRNATQFVVVIMFSLVGIIAIFSAHVVYIWTGNAIAANWAGPILFWYALGNGFFCVSAFQFYLQFAFGDIKLQVISDTLLVLISLPLIIFSAYHYGAKGTAITWFLMRGLFFFIWSPIVHHKYALGIHYDWLLKDIFPIFIAVLATVLCIKKIPIHFELISRVEGFIILTCFALFTLLTAALASSTCRDFFARFAQERKDLKV